MKNILLILFVTIKMSLAASFNTQQLVVVTTQEINSSVGVLQRYEKKNSDFVKVGSSMKVYVGRNGLGWGIGLHKTPKNATYIKKEGDGRAPMGIFKLQNAFGYDSLNVSYPYVVYKKIDHCVDDVNSKVYNSIVKSSEVTKDYKSFEHMKLNSDYYKYGVVVDHNSINNPQKSKKGFGSCIFIHIKDKPTAGCSAISSDGMETIIRWLKKDANPLLIQGTKSVVEDLQSTIVSH